MTDLERAKAFFKNDQFAIKTTGAEILAVGDHYAKCRRTLDERHMNASGRVMGGVYYTLADFAFAVAANFDQPPTVTAVSQISYLGVPKGNTLTAESRLLKDGRRTCFYEITITDETGTMVAVVSTTGAHISAFRPEHDTGGH